MTFINYAAKEINCKIVYYGPGLGGKTTNLQHIYNKTAQTRTVVDDLAVDLLGSPGQVFYDASRKLILKGVDGIVFVADSQTDRMEANVESIRNLELNLQEHGFDLASISYALQFNKRDLPNVMPVDEMYRMLNFKREPTFAGVAPQGVGVFETLKSVAKQILVDLRKR